MFNAETFFQQYANAFNQFDAEAITAHYACPCAVTDGDGALVFESMAPIIEKFSNNTRSLKDMGYVNSTFKVIEQTPMPPNSHAIHIAWYSTFADSSFTYKCLYICKQINGEWKITTAHVYQDA
jgi:ketosteroid isomerase-like protein